MENIYDAYYFLGFWCKKIPISKIYRKAISNSIKLKEKHRIGASEEEESI